MESWQSGNAADSKSAEPMLNWRAGSNPVRSLKYGSKMLIYQHSLEKSGTKAVSSFDY